MQSQEFTFSFLYVKVDKTIHHITSLGDARGLCLKDRSDILLGCGIGDEAGVISCPGVSEAPCKGLSRGVSNKD